jgi:hypothetical protein
MSTSKTQFSQAAVGGFVELAEIERQIQKWTNEAKEMGRSMEALAVALRGDASRLDFRGDLIVLDPDDKPAELQLIVNLAKVRNLISNLRLLKAWRRQLETLADRRR